jgi:ABC-2 type transport system permease protein
MLAKEWRDARWKLALAIFAFLVLLPTIRSYEAIQDDLRTQARWAKEDLASSEEFMGSAAEQKKYASDTRRWIQELQSPEYLQETARMELRDTVTYRNLLVVALLGGLLGIGLVSGEVSRGSIFLILSRPVSRGRVLLTKYAVCAACLFAAAAFGGASVLLAAYARGYPPEAVEVGRIVGSTALGWLASLFVLGVALVASVVLRDVLRTLMAAAAAMFVILAGPDLVWALVEWIVWGDRIYYMDPWSLPGWYGTFEHLKLVNYWTGTSTYLDAPTVAQSVVVCAITAAVALLVALWLFRRKAY